MVLNIMQLFYDAMGNPLVNETVRFNINGVIYEKEQMIKVLANLTISLFILVIIY